GARVKDVDPALHSLDRVEQSVKVVEIGSVAAHAGHVPADQLDGLVERLLPPAGDENVSAFCNEALGARQRHAARAAGDDCNLTVKLSHDFLLQAPSVSPEGGADMPEMGSPAPGVQSESTHIGGAKTIRLGAEIG